MGDPSRWSRPVATRRAANSRHLHVRLTPKKDVVTDTAGCISNAEIQEIIDTGNVQKTYIKEGSNILVFNNTEWVAYMDDEISSGDEDDYEMDIDTNYWEACEGQFSSVQQLQDRKDSIPGHCMEQYISDVQISVLDGALKKYKDLVDNGYDGKFKTYERYVKEQIPGQIYNFMASDKVDKYFKCKEYRTSGTCCKDCKYATCIENCIKGSDCEHGKAETRYIPNATYTLTDADGFYKDLSDTWGVDKEWITLGKRQIRINNGCQYAGENVNECIQKRFDWFYNYYKVKIYNPKEIIGNSYANATDMLDRFRNMQLSAIWDKQYVESDQVDATSLPAFSTDEAVASMEKIVEKANEIEKQEREEFILNFIMGLLFFIPFVGDATVGLTAVRTISRLIGGVGDAAVTVYEVVKDPDNAFMAVFSYLAGAGLGRSGFRNAANSRRAIKTDDYNALGSVKVKLDDVQSPRGKMCPC
ncbi:hypothetical protein ACEQ8H_007161 [Pleosporales sp. CAS-2024a]